MKTYTLEYHSKLQLEQFIEKCNLLSYNNILVQIFTSMIDKEEIINLRNEILNEIPYAKIIGASTCGEISNNGSISNSTVISFCTFENTKIDVSYVEHTDTSFNMGQSLINSFDNTKEDLKLIISFADGLNTNGEEYLNGISSINSKVIVAGGLAGDYEKFTQTYVFTEDFISDNGAVAAAFYNNDLTVYTEYSFNWESVGKKHIVDKSDKNRVYKINGMTAVDFYSFYLGQDIADLLPSIGIEFPLVINRNGINVARAVLAKHEDGSLTFAGNINEGSEVQFGHGDVQMIVTKGLETVKDILDYPVESIFIYSCMARRALLQEDINLEMLPLRELAPISGFFTYGEFYHNCKDEMCKTQLLNQTMTILGISENNKKTTNISANIFSKNQSSVNDANLHRLQALSNLLEQTTKELEEFNDHLSLKVQEEVSKNQEKDAMLQMAQTQSQLGEMMEMIIHQWRQPISAITSSITSGQVYMQLDMLSDDKVEDIFKNILVYTDHLDSTIEDFRDLFKSNKKFEDIANTELINKSLTIINPLMVKSNVKLMENYNSQSTLNISTGLMMQVILNITKNAIDILLERNIQEPVIEFRTYDKNNSWVLEIRDNGGGIPKDILPKIFDKRFTTKGATHGTGLGLDMSRTIVESKLNGTLSAHNDKGWAVFTIKIPV
ncbi:MAG: FIST N-terminal domain-containing protein [Campylobacterota bacterium]|nr:FIST N-terminal domain-containing protein [Campylobacterota bacterium]